MSVLISCPACGNQGDLPAGGLGGGIVTCRNCGVRFAPVPEITHLLPPPVPPVGDDSVTSVWVGGPAADVVPVLPVDPALPLSVAVDDTVEQTQLTTAPEITPETAAAHLNWLRTETHRFAVYVDRQLAALGKMREQIANYESKTRAEAVVREQTLNRERAALDARAADLARRESELAAALTRQGDQLAAELGEIVATEREHLATRAAELEKMELSLHQRLLEADELEHALREELREQEMLVERQRRELNDVADQLRTRTPPPVGTPAPSDTPPPPARPAVTLACG